MALKNYWGRSARRRGWIARHHQPCFWPANFLSFWFDTFWVYLSICLSAYRCGKKMQNKKRKNVGHRLKNKNQELWQCSNVYTFFTYRVKEITALLGACRKFFCVFVPFLAVFLFQGSFFSKSRSFTWRTFSHFETNLDRLASQPIQLFFAIQILFQISFQIMDSVGQAQGGRGGCSGGVPNYKN